MKTSTGAKLVDNLIDARDRELDYFLLHVVLRDADATGLFRDDYDWTRPGRCRVLNGDGMEKWLPNRVHLLRSRGID